MVTKQSTRLVGRSWRSRWIWSCQIASQCLPHLLSLVGRSAGDGSFHLGSLSPEICLIMHLWEAWCIYSWRCVIKSFLTSAVMKWWALSPLRQKGLGLIPEWVWGLSGWSLHALLAHQAEWRLWSVTAMTVGHVKDWLATSPGQAVPRSRPLCLWLQHCRTQSMSLAMCNTH